MGRGSLTSHFGGGRSKRHAVYWTAALYLVMDEVAGKALN